ncbi:MAG: chorismate pyruvate-lyase family protein [Promethearchaeota archaeon]
MKSDKKSDYIRLLKSKFFPFIEFGSEPLDWDTINLKVRQLGSNNAILSKSLKLIISNTGSVTRALEIISNRKINVKTIFQEIGVLQEEDKKLLKYLRLKPGDQLNFREVWLTDLENNYVFAFSLTPIKLLNNGFKEDLIKADIPIGRLIEKHKIECRKEIVKISAIEHHLLNHIGIKWDNIAESALIPYRIYNIIYKEQILMVIIEFFNPLLI